MTNLDFFKQQADFFLKDYQSRTFNDNDEIYEYHPRFFHDIDEIILNFNIEEEEPFTLMNAQHIIARLAGFYKWTELKKASEPILEIGKLLLNNRESYQQKQGFFTNMVESLIVSDWKSYETENLKGFSDEDKLEIFKKVFLEEPNSKKRRNVPKIVLDFSNDENAQDMLRKIMNDKGLSAEKAILSCITQKNCISVLTNGWAEMALSLWGHANWGDPTATKEKLENPIVEIKLSKDKEYLISSIMETINVSLKKAVLYCMLFALESLGYHI